MPLFTALAADAGSTLTGVTWASYITAADFQPLLDGIMSLLPVIIPVTLGLLAIRKGWSFLMGNIYSA